MPNRSIESEFLCELEADFSFPEMIGVERGRAGHPVNSGRGGFMAQPCPREKKDSPACRSGPLSFVSIV